MWAEARVRPHDSDGLKMGSEVKAYFKIGLSLNGLPKLLAHNRKKTKENSKALGHLRQHCLQLLQAVVLAIL